jgi:hypothetical protein
VSRRLAGISTGALRAMQSERQAKIAALQAELRDIERELAERQFTAKPKLKLVEAS